MNDNDHVNEEKAEFPGKKVDRDMDRQTDWNTQPMNGCEFIWPQW